LEYANTVWHPYRIEFIKDRSKVQMRASKLSVSIKHLEYKQRLQWLNFPTLRGSVN